MEGQVGEPLSQGNTFLQCYVRQNKQQGERKEERKRKYTM